MADFRNEIEKRRTFAIISHPDAGKTTLTEKFLLYGGAIQLAGRGARVAAVSLPCRYLHSPACVVAKRDMEQTLALLQELARQLAV